MIDVSFYATKKILITGASGFIGSCLSQKLLAMGAQVHGLSRTRRPSSIKELHWWHCDLGNEAQVRKIIAKIRPDSVFHLASCVSGSRGIDLVLPTLHSNLISTVNLLMAATEAHCQRIVHIGSLEEPQSDTEDAIPSSPYAAAKWSASAYARMFYSLYETPVVIARLFMVYGPGQRDIKKLIPYVALSLLQNISPKVSNGKRLVDWIYVDDAVEGLLAIMQAPGLEGKRVDVGSGGLVSTKIVVENLSDIINAKVSPLFGAIRERPMEQIRVAEITNTHNLTGWKPTTSLSSGLKDTVRWYDANLDIFSRIQG